MVLGKCFVNDLLNIYLCCFQVPVLENRGSVSEWVAENFSSTTLNLAPRNWLQAINEDKTGMRSDWRQEKIAFISDYIGVDATRTMTMSETQGFVRQSRADFAGEPSTSPPGSRRRGRPPGD